jgi:hypothetical protein
VGAGAGSYFLDPAFAYPVTYAGVFFGATSLAVAGGVRIGAGIVGAAAGCVFVSVNCHFACRHLLLSACVWHCRSTRNLTYQPLLCRTSTTASLCRAGLAVGILPAAAGWAVLCMPSVGVPFEVALGTLMAGIGGSFMLDVKVQALVYAELQLSHSSS